MRKVFAGLSVPLLLALGLLVAVLVMTDAPATAAPTTLTTIYDIQYTTTPGGDGTYPSPYAGQTVTTSGTVCAVLSKGYIVAEASGPWHAIYVYVGSSGYKPALGTEVQINGEVIEHYGMTEFSYPSVIELGAGDPVCDPTIVTTADAPFDDPAQSEPYESILIEYRMITVTDTGQSYRFSFTDGTGETSKWGDWGYYPSPLPPVGTRYEFVRGPLAYTYDEYRVMPPTAADARLLDTTPPTVTATTPADGASGVNPYRPLDATFSEPISPTTVSSATFQVAGPGGSVAGSVSYDGATYRATFVPATALAFNTLHTATLTTGIEDLTGNALATDVSWTFTTGAEDTTPPAVAARFPEPEAISVSLSADVVVTFTEELDPETVVAENFTLAGPYGAVPWGYVDYDDAAYRVTLTPRGLLLPTTRYTMTIGSGVTDWAGYPVEASDRTWSFTTQAEPPMFAFHGDVHNHTSYSDGSLTPSDAFTSAIQCGLDFLAVTDHSYAIDDAEWLDTLAQAEAATVNGQFVGLRGFEYTQGAEGHANVYNTVRHATRSDVGYAYADYTPNLEQGVTVEGFYHWLAVTGTQAIDSAGVVMQFNHPGWINFNDWTYHPELSDIALLEEVGNGWGTSYVFSWDEWIRSLDYGWRVGATNNSDNHATDWGCITPHRTGVVMPELTKESLLDGLRARRTFSTEDSNYALFFRANGYWMGSEIPNSGQVTLEIEANDPDGEQTTLVRVYTADEQVVAELEPNSDTVDWTFDLSVAPGAHYFFVLAVQEDGDRIVSSPVWLTGEEDVRLTDLSIQPTIPTVYNPSLLTARVSNRGASTQTLTVTFSVNGTPVGTVPVTVTPCSQGPCDDAYANLSWQPAVTGTVVLSASLSGAPASDNPGDNSRSLELNVTDERVPLILIDAGHNNIGAMPRDARMFADDMTDHGYNILFNLDEITAGDLNTETVRLLILNAYGPQPLTVTETQAIADFVVAGGNLWLNGMSDYTSKVSWAHNLADRMNGLVSALETATGETIPVRFNDDEVLDGNDNNGYPWGILWHTFPSSRTTGVGMNVTRIQSWSDCSLIDRNGSALTAADLGPDDFMFIVGDLDEGTGTFGEPNRTSNVDAEGPGYPTDDAYIYPDTILLAGAAGVDIPGPAGRIFFYGDSNDPFNIFAYVAGDGKQNELFNLEVVRWLLGDPLQKMTIAEARVDAELNDTPDHLNELVWVEGEITAGFGEFFNVLYVQDETGGVTIHAPAGDIDAGQYARGAQVRVVGTVGIYNGDTEIEFFEAEQVQVLTPTMGVEPTPLPMSTYSATLEQNEGWLAVVTGTVMAKIDSSAILVDDGSGPVRAFLDGYNGAFDNVNVMDEVRVVGLTSEDGNGPRLRVRNHGAHPELPDDVTVLAQGVEIYLPLVLRSYTP
jgi:hypothetical protein